MLTCLHTQVPYLPAYWPMISRMPVDENVNQSIQGHDQVAFLMLLLSLGCTWRTPSENFLQVLWLWLNREGLLSSRQKTVKVKNPGSQDGNTLRLWDLGGCELAASLAHVVGSGRGGAISK